MDPTLSNPEICSSLNANLSLLGLVGTTPQSSNVQSRAPDARPAARETFVRPSGT